LTNDDKSLNLWFLLVSMISIHYTSRVNIICIFNFLLCRFRELNVPSIAQLRITQHWKAFTFLKSLIRIMSEEAEIHILPFCYVHTFLNERQQSCSCSHPREISCLCHNLLTIFSLSLYCLFAYIFGLQCRFKIWGLYYPRKKPVYPSFYTLIARSIWFFSSDWINCYM